MTSKRLRTGISVTDQFCGAGGSSLGARKAGLDVRLALNHWDLAIRTHNTNFPDTDHDCTDVSASDPRRYPSTDILITSPECTTFSPAGGSRRSKASPQTKLFADPSIQRSRATMWDVPRYAEYHDYNIIITENVVEAAKWHLFPDWLRVMERLGYCHQIVSMNSMFCHPTPQSRDRIYVVFWKAGNHAPRVDLCPPAPCSQCEKDVQAVQSWKNGRTVGKYRTQYVYHCPTCDGEVKPYYFAAINALDFTVPAQRIRDRKRPLKPRTMARIRWGLERYGRTPLVVRTNMTSGVGCRVRAATIAPMDTQPGSNITAMVSPFVVETLFSHAGDSRAYPVDESIGTQGARNAKALAIPPMMQITLAGGDYYRCRDLDEPTAAMAARGNVQALVTPAFLADFYGRGREASPMDDPARPCTTRIHQGVVVPPAFLANYYGGGGQERRVTPLDGAQCTVSVENRTGVVVPPAFLANYYSGGGEVTPIDKAQGTVATVDRSALVESDDAVEAEDCYFRMLQPHEIGAAMAFPGAYVVLGNKREMVKQYGNAVTPPAMEFLIQRCVESLAA